MAPVRPTRVRAIATVGWLDEASLYIVSLLGGVAAGIVAAFL